MNQPEQRPHVTVPRVARGAALLVGGSLAMRAMAMLSLAVLARLLEPADFGVVAAAVVFLGLTRALVSNQFHFALVRLANPARADLDTAFTLSLLWGLSASGVLYLAAGPVSGLINSPGTGAVLRWLSLVPLLESLRSPAFVRFERQLNMAPAVAVDLAGQFLQYATSITAAVIFRTHWALVAGYIAGALARSLLSHLSAPHRPRVSVANWRSFMSFGGWLSGAGVAGFFVSYMDVLLVSSRLGPSAAGLYNTGAEVVRMATDYLAMPLTRAAYPGMSGVSGDAARLARSLRLGVEVLLGLILPVGVGLACIAHRAVPVLLGDGWDHTIPVVQILAPVSAVATLSFLVQSFAMAKDQTRRLFLRNAAVAGVQVVLIFAGLAVFGIAGAAAGRAAGMLALAVLSLRIASDLTGESARALVRIPARSLAASAVLAIAVLALDPLWANRFADSNLAATLCGVLTGMIAYSASHLLMWRMAGRPDGFERLVLGRLGGTK